MQTIGASGTRRKRSPAGISNPNAGDVDPTPAFRMSSGDALGVTPRASYGSFTTPSVEIVSNGRPANVDAGHYLICINAA